tara:strand:+ start:2130 stop:2864 length:735 start_codon:yes stop_codon:yes gene_type:complete
MKIVSTIEARMTSSRLPGKPLFKANNATMLEHLVNRLKSIDLIDEIILATTINKEDDALVAEAEELNISTFRGDEDNVMKRVIDAAESRNGELVVEITADCPIIDPVIINESINIFISNNYDYVGNALVRSYPDGMDTQVFSLDTLKKSYSMTNSKLDYEHVTLHIRNNPKLFKHFDMIAPDNLYWPDLGLTLDEEKDYILIKKIIEHFGNNNNLFSCKEILDYLKINPDLLDINKSVKRKGNT